MRVVDSRSIPRKKQTLQLYHYMHVNTIQILSTTTYIIYHGMHNVSPPPHCTVLVSPCSLYRTTSWRPDTPGSYDSRSGSKQGRGDLSGRAGVKMRLCQAWTREVGTWLLLPRAFLTYQTAEPSPCSLPPTQLLRARVGRTLGKSGTGHP